MKMRGANIGAPYKKTEKEMGQLKKYTSGEITCSDYSNALGYRVCVVDI